nr:immunoglobulin heavy chain junction region [Macaca mulatta]
CTRDRGLDGFDNW